MRSKILITLLLLLVAVLPARADDFTVDGLCYDINSDGKTVTVTYSQYAYGIGASYPFLSGELTIPCTVTYSGFGTYSVTSIDEVAFYGCSGLTSVSIPNSVTEIGWSAFYGCSGLTSVSIGNSVTEIGDDAFYGCSGLTSVTIGNSVTSIGWSAFYGCERLTSITIPNSVTKIGDFAFYGCTGLTSVTIGNSVTEIGLEAFWCCTGLTSVTIPNSVTSIGNFAFSGCTGLTSIKVESGNTVYDSRNNCNAIIETASNTLIQGCKYTTIPNSVTKIGDWAFASCSGLKSITIPNSVTSIGHRTFGYCDELETIYSYIKDPTKVSYGYWIFDNTNIKKIYVPKGTLSLYKTTSPWSAYLLEEIEPEHGDLNGDGAVNSGDVSTLYTIIMNGATGSDGDLNNDEAVNTGDVSSLYRIILGEEK